LASAYGFFRSILGPVLSVCVLNCEVMSTLVIIAILLASSNVVSHEDPANLASAVTLPLSLAVGQSAESFFMDHLMLFVLF